jgi:serine/threonine protein phosphatase PrpC
VRHLLIGFCSGSGLVADHASKRLHCLLAQRPEFKKGDYAGALKAALADEDGLLLESFKHESAEPAMSGSTAAICLINLTEGELVVSNLGDSHVLLAERDPKTECPYHIVGVSPPLSTKEGRLIAVIHWFD